MKMQIHWCCCFAICLAVSGLAGLGDIPGPVFGTAEPITSLGLFAGTGFAFENCGGIDLEELDELGYVDRTHFLSLAIGLIGGWKVYRDASLEGKAFLAGPGKGYAVNWKQVVWRKDGEALAVLPGYIFSSGWKNVVYESGIDWFMPWVSREDLYGQSSVWELPLVYSTRLQSDSLHSALDPTFNLCARLAYARYKMKWVISESYVPTITHDLGSHAAFLGSVSGNLRFHLGDLLVSNELGVAFVPQAENRKSKAVFILGLSVGVPFNEQILP